MEIELNFEATELRLGLPGSDESAERIVSPAKNNKRASPESTQDVSSAKPNDREAGPAPKAQIIGWPPVRSYRKNSIQVNNNYVKVGMDGAAYLRKIDLKVCNGYSELLKALESMFKMSIGDYSGREGYNGSEYLPAYEDKDGDLMLVGDVPWEMFKSSCKRLRIMKESDARGLGSCGV